MGLSQEQINAILEGTGTYGGDTEGLSAQEQEFLMSFSGIAMDAGSVAVSQALGKAMTVGHAQLSTTDSAALKQELNGNYVLIRTGYHTNKEHESILLIKDYDVAVIFDILMGKDGRNPDLEIGDLQISAIGEVMNQLVGAAATALSKEFERKLAMIAPDSQSLLPESSFPTSYQTGPLVQVHYQLIIEGVLDSEIYEVRTLDSAKQLYNVLTGKDEQVATQSAANPTVGVAPQADPMMGSAQAAYPAMQQQAMMPAGGGYLVPPSHQPQTASVRPVEFAALAPGVMTTGNPNLDRVMDIPLKVTVELGSSKLKVKNVLDLSKGSIVELDKLAGEPVDMLVNGRLMAKGEVVVINENFGVRITEILGPMDRLQHLQN